MVNIVSYHIYYLYRIVRLININDQIADVYAFMVTFKVKKRAQNTRNMQKCIKYTKFSLFAFINI